MRPTKEKNIYGSKKIHSKQLYTINKNLSSQDLTKRTQRPNWPSETFHPMEHHFPWLIIFPYRSYLIPLLSPHLKSPHPHSIPSLPITNTPNFIPSSHHTSLQAHLMPYPHTENPIPSPHFPSISLIVTPHFPSNSTYLFNSSQILTSNVIFIPHPHLKLTSPTNIWNSSRLLTLHPTFQTHYIPSLHTSHPAKLSPPPQIPSISSHPVTTYFTSNPLNLVRSPHLTSLAAHHQPLTSLIASHRSHPIHSSHTSHASPSFPRQARCSCQRTSTRWAKSTTSREVMPFVWDSSSGTWQRLTSGSTAASPRIPSGKSTQISTFTVSVCERGGDLGGRETCGKDEQGENDRQREKEIGREGEAERGRKEEVRG